MATIKGVWVFNDTITFPSNTISNEGEVSFNSKGNTWIGINVVPERGFSQDPTISSNEMGYWELGCSTKVYNIDSGWVNEAYRTLDFGTGEQEVSDEFYTWFTANAVQQVDNASPKISGLWEFNDTLNYTGYIECDVNFKSGYGVSYVRMTFGYYSYSTGSDYELAYFTDTSSKRVYDNGWLYDSDKRIDFGYTPQTVSDEFYTWLTANATQKTFVATFDLASLNLSAGTYRISAKARASGYVDSAESSAISYTVNPANTYDIIVYNADGALVDSEDIYPNTIKTGETLDVTLEMVYGTGIESVTGADVVVDSYVADEGFFVGYGTFYLTVSNATDDVVIRLTNMSGGPEILPE